MRAVRYHHYGPPEVLQVVADIAPPMAGPGQALVRVVASSVNPVDWHTIRGEPLVARLESGLRGPKRPGIGADLAGVVEAVGDGVTSVKPGDEVFGMSIQTWADVVAVKAEGLVAKPATVPWEAAGCVGVAGLTALQGIVGHAHVRHGQRVLVAGAGGGVGHFAVQIAKAFGATVTASTSAGHVAMVRGLGADEVVDYRLEDATEARGHYDIVFDAGGWLSFEQLRRALRPGGTAVLAGAGRAPNLLGIARRLVGARVRTRLEGRQYVSYLARRTPQDLEILRGMLADGRLRPVIDRTYPLADIVSAVTYQEGGQAGGKVAVIVGDPETRSARRSAEGEGSGADTRI